MIDIDCPKKCCNARYCPLILAWATTIHKFQGFEAGFGKDDHIKYIIADINTLGWEKLHPGTAYVVASRAKTIGKVTNDVKYPTRSNLFFVGTLGERRFKECRVKQNGEECLLVEQCDAWVTYLTSRVEDTKIRRSKESMVHMTEFVTSSLDRATITCKKDLQEKIVAMIHGPNDSWKHLRKNYLVR